MIFALRKHRENLLASDPFRMINDHQALQVTSRKNMHGRSTWWLDLLAVREFIIEYKAGASHAEADYLPSTH